MEALSDNQIIRGGNIMNNVMAILNNNPQGISLKELTGHRSLASVPIASRYRLIDFPLSNLVNSGIDNVGILLESRFRSLLDHIGPGKAWGLDTKNDGLFLLPPAHINKTGHIYKGDIENFQANLDYIHRSSQEYVIVSYPSIVCNIDYVPIVKQHIDSRADITVVYKDLETLYKDSHYTTININDDNRITDMKINPDTRKNTQVSLKRYIMRKDILLEIIDQCVSTGQWDFEKNGVSANLQNYNVQGYEIHNYIAIISSLSEYYRRNMELLQPKIFNDFFNTNGPVFTKPKDEAATKYTSKARVHNIIAANGCLINGEVEKSVLFRGVKIGENASVKNSIVMQKSQVGEGAELENVILDKNVTITPGKKLKGDPSFPLIIDKNSII